MRKHSILSIVMFMFFLVSVFIKNDQTVAEETHKNTVDLYWTDTGITKQLRGEPTKKMKLGDDFSTHNINSIIPNVHQEGQILIPMPSNEDLPKTEQQWNELSNNIYVELKGKINSGLKNGVKDFELRTVQNINIPGYFDSGRQSDVIKFINAYTEALYKVKEDLFSGGHSVNVNGIWGSNGGYAAAKVIPELIHNPVDRGILVDARAYKQDVKNLYNKLSGNLSIINTAGDAPSFDTMVAKHEVSKSLKRELPNLRVIWTDAKGPDMFFRQHIKSLNPESQLKVKEYTGSGYTKLGITTGASLKNGLFEDRQTFSPMSKLDLIERVFGPLTKFIGKGSRWIGIDLSGGHEAEKYERDILNRRPLGNTTLSGLSYWDKLARQHDIQDWVNWHAPPGTEVEVPGSHSKEYYTSQGHESGLHNRWVIDSWIGLKKGNLWRQTPEHTENVVQLDDLLKQFPISTNDINKPDITSKEKGGIEIDPQPFKVGKGGAETRDEARKSRPSEESLSWSFEIPEEVK
ncbi:MAG: hypothetical protein ACUZ8I_14605 [Candidatus Scalindua sp.]